MPSSENSLMVRWWRRLFPVMPDFYSLLNTQCDLLVECTAALQAFMQCGEVEHGEQVQVLERRANALRAENMMRLQQAFATPFDREDIYRSIAALHDVVDYAGTTVREMNGLQLGPNEHTLEMAILLHEGALALQQGYARLQRQPLLAEADAEAARTTERDTEDVYRKALSELFDAQHYVATKTEEQQQTADSLEVLMQTLTTRELAAVGSAVGFVVEILKRREVYRHMSNAADKIERAGEVLHDIVVKIA